MIKKVLMSHEKHAELKAIIDDSVVVAKKFFGFTEAKLEEIM